MRYIIASTVTIGAPTGVPYRIDINIQKSRLQLLIGYSDRSFTALKLQIRIADRAGR